jgi:DNA-binding NtrC family response regulator
METNRSSILVIDDNESFRAVLGVVLEASSFRVKLAANQSEALTFLKTELFSLVITDYRLGALGNPEPIARSLLDAAHPVPVGCVTGWHNIPRNIESRYAFVLHKPVTAEKLLAAVRALYWNQDGRRLRNTPAVDRIRNRPSATQTRPKMK